MENPWIQQWADAWRAFIPSDKDSNPWRAALDNWWQTFDPQESQSVDVFEKFIGQGRAFFELGERVAKAAADSQDAFDWSHINEQALSSLNQLFDWNGESAPNMGFWQLPLDNWQRTMSTLAAGVPGDYLRGFSPSDTIREGAEAKLKQFLSTPGIGYSREFQEQFQHLGQFAMAYEKAYQRYVAAFMEMGKQSVELLQQRLHQRAEKNEPITSIRELYNLWVDCSEEVHGAYVMTDEYVQVHGQLVNALMALKHHGGRMIDEYAGAYNLPTRVEMDTVHHRLQQSRRDNKGLQDQLLELSEQLASLRTVTDQLSAQNALMKQQLQTASQAGKPKTSAAKAPAKKTATAKAKVKK